MYKEEYNESIKDMKYAFITMKGIVRNHHLDTFQFNNFRGLGLRIFYVQ